MQCSGLIDFAPSARNSQKPWLNQTWTVMNEAPLDLALPKQMK
jgi:hypothetical protein